MTAIVTTNRAPSNALNDARFAARRTTLLASCVTSHDDADRDGAAYARFAINGEAKGQTTLDVERKAACASFPVWKSGRGKPVLSKTPHDRFRSTFDRYILLRAVNLGEHEKITCGEARALVTKFLQPNSRLRLAETVRLVKAAQQAADKAARDAIPDADKEAAKANEEAANNAAVATAVALSPLLLNNLADAIAAMDMDNARLCSDALAAVMGAIVAKADAIAAADEETARKAA